jgi:hypothetical protein
MTAESTWTPYSEKLLEQLNKLAPQAVQRIDGKDLAPAAGFAHGQIRAFQAARLAKIGLASFAGQDLHVGFCMIFPAEGYDLPLFMSRWEETRQELNYYVDLLPTVDFLVDEPYRKKYIESVDPSWQRFASMAGIRPEEDDRLRSSSSIIYTAARCPVEREGLRLAALAVHTEYLKHYIAFVQEASQVSDTVKLAEIKRKTAAVRAMLRDYLQRFLTGPAGRVLGSAQAEYLIATCS